MGCCCKGTCHCGLGSKSKVAPYTVLIDGSFIEIAGKRVIFKQLNDAIRAAENNSKEHDVCIIYCDGNVVKELRTVTERRWI